MVNRGCVVAIVALLACIHSRIDTAMALLETDFEKAIKDFASNWQSSLEHVGKSGNGEWDDVRVLERVCFLANGIALHRWYMMTEELTVWHTISANHQTNFSQLGCG